MERWSELQMGTGTMKIFLAIIINFHLSYVLLNGNHFVQPADLAKPCIEEYINYLKDPAQSGVLDAQCLGHPTCVKEVKGSTLKIFSDLPSPIAKQLSLHHFVFHTKLLLIT